MHFITNSTRKINRAELRIFIDWRGNLATGAGGSRRPATAIDLLKAPRPTRRATGFRAESWS